MKNGKLDVIVGAQYGSEGKGLLSANLANKYDVHIRVGSPNAGHTFYWKNEKHIMQTIPCGWINPNARIIIGRGALINMKLLVNEIQHIEQYYPDFKKRLFIDSDAGILDECFRQQENGVNGEMHKRIGSTGEGVGLARIARIERDPDKFRLFKNICEEYDMSDICYINTPKMIYDLQRAGENILIEGSQGSGLSLLHSHFPYCTSIDTNAAQLLAEVGIAPSNCTNVILVARTYPIRVAGNSGYMANEISWDILSSRIGVNVSETTTVTKKIRRVAEWDDDLFSQSIILNQPTEIFLNFVNYIDPELWDCTDMNKIRKSEKLMVFIKAHNLIGCITMWGTGPSTIVCGKI